jgi:hypothetical protein
MTSPSRFCQPRCVCASPRRSHRGRHMRSASCTRPSLKAICERWSLGSPSVHRKTAASSRNECWRGSRPNRSSAASSTAQAQRWACAGWPTS